MVHVTGWRRPQAKGITVLIEPVSTPLPGWLAVINTLSRVDCGQMHVRVANLRDEDVWLQPRTWIVVLHAATYAETLGSPKVNLIQVSANKARVVLQEQTITEPRNEVRGKCPIDQARVTCTPEQKWDLENLLIQLASIFAKNDDDLGSTNTYICTFARLPLWIRSL